MQQVDLILTNAHVLTMDESLAQFNPGAVAIRGDSIVAVDTATAISENYVAREIIDCHGNILMPGLVNVHTHVPMTLLRGLADDLRLDVWLLGYMMPVEREFVSPEFVQLGTLLGCAEMIRSGITCFADMYYFEEDVAIATAQAGLRAVLAESVLKFPTPDAQFYEDSLAATREFIQRWKNHPLIVPAVAPHAPYTCTPEILQACRDLALEYDVPLHIHISETASEVEAMRAEQGMPVVPYVKKLNLFEAKVIAAHCVHIDEGEMRTLKHSNVGVAHNPSSNLKLSSGVAPVKRMIELGLNVGIGTDGVASNNDHDMFEEIRLTTFLAKGTSGDPTTLPAVTTLLMATRMGANAIHVGDITGSLTPGKRADLILIQIGSLHNMPRFYRDPNGIYAQLVYAAKSTDVTDVMVNGQWLMRNQQLLTLNEAELMIQGQAVAHKIDQFLAIREQSVLSKLVAIGGAMEEESYEIQAKVSINNPESVFKALHNPAIEIIRHRHYRQYDTYFSFSDPSQGYIRYREDHFIDERGNTTNTRNRLTHIGPAREAELPQKVLLSRSRFLAPATHTARFYREYFKPAAEFEIEKERFRYLVRFHKTEFFINVDHVTKPDLGYFLEIKSRTWSRQDARNKSQLAVELIQLLGESSQQATTHDYLDMIQNDFD